MARRKARQRISYVLPLASTSGGHRLGVNSLAVDTEHSILYSGGRDGMICAWDLHLPLHDPNTPYVKEPTTFRTQTHAHMQWINDIKLVQGNRGVVSASSDITVQLWRPHSTEEDAKPETLGQHTDYVKCLASPGLHADWIASGGLDHKIKLWDLNGAGERLTIDAGEDASKGSVYALSVCGSLLASGGPDSVLRVWDPKSGKLVTKFVGHTDNLRSILISEGGDMLMTASSDQTIKVWSMTAGRCTNTLTMHNDSVWSLYSNHPQLAVFYSGDRSGLVAKTDVRGNPTMDEGISVAVAQEHDGINHVIATGDYLWTATAMSSINRYADVDTTAEMQPPESPRQNRLSSLVSRPKIPSPPSRPTHRHTPSQSEKIPLLSVLKISNLMPSRMRDIENSTIYSGVGGRKLSEAVVDSDIDIVPIRARPEDTIEGLHGLIKHVILNDRRRVLTLDDAGEVVMWDILKCVPIKSFGKQHLEDVEPLVNTKDSIQNWCLIDTRTGSLAITMEENYAFDAEMYADETEFKGTVEFREDQRINLGKWVLRYLFAGLIDEEIKRDETHRKTLKQSAGSAHDSLRPNAPRMNGMNGTATEWADDGSNTTPRATNGYPMTPGLAIGVATPGTAGEEGKGGHNRSSGDYFSSRPPPVPPLPGNSKASESGSEAAETALSPNEEKEPEKDSKSATLFGKKFRMNFPKKLGRSSTDHSKPAEKDEKAEESDKSSEKEDKIVEDNFYGVVQKIRNDYDDKLAANPSEFPEPGITPSLPNDTPVVKLPPSTTIMIQEDSTEAGGVADLYRGTVRTVGQDADQVEKAAPMWLGELLLRNQQPIKDIVKLSFVLLPFEDRLPGIAGPDGNARLNANRMLRAKKVLGYVTDRIEPTVAEGTEAPAQPTPALKAEEYLELYCQDKLIPPNMTLAMIKMHVWKAASDVVLYYKSNGRRPELEEAWAKKKAETKADGEGGDATGAGAGTGTGAGSGAGAGAGAAAGAGATDAQAAGTAAA